MTGASFAIDVRNVSKTFKAARVSNQVSLRVMSGEMVALIGPSGSGKSTLLHHLSGLVSSDRTPSAIALLGQPVRTNGAITRQIRQVRGVRSTIFGRCFSFGLIDGNVVLDKNDRGLRRRYQETLPWTQNTVM